MRRKRLFSWKNKAASLLLGTGSSFSQAGSGDIAVEMSRSASRFCVLRRSRTWTGKKMTSSKYTLRWSKCWWCQYFPTGPSLLFSQRTTWCTWSIHRWKSSLWWRIDEARAQWLHIWMRCKWVCSPVHYHSVLSSRARRPIESSRLLTLPSSTALWVAFGLELQIRR